MYIKILLLNLTVVLASCSGPAAFKAAEHSSAYTDILEHIPLRKPMSENEEGPTLPSSDAASENSDVRFAETPKAQYGLRKLSVDLDDVESSLQGGKIDANFNNMPLPAFINEVFGNQLGLSFVISPKLRQQKDLVTLSLAEPQEPANLFRMARIVLADYGVGMQALDGLLKFNADKDASGGSIPLLVSGVALPEVPPTHRPVFALIPLSVIRNNQASKWLKELYRGTSITVFDDSDRNAVLLKGPSDLVKQAASAVKLLDQPLLKGKYSKSVSPAYMQAGELARSLVEILQTEGYAATTKPPYGSIIVLPLTDLDRIIIFANSQDSLAHAVDWVKELDQQFQAQIADGVFSYQAKNVQVEHIASMVRALSGDANKSGVNTKNTSKTSQNSNAPLQTGSQNTSVAGGRLVIDENRNTLYFKGDGKSWLQLLPTIEKMDRPIPSVLLEVLLAEVTLSDQQNTGVEWLFDGKGVDGDSLSGGTLGGLDLGGSGLSLTFDSAGQTRGIINAFYSNSRAVIRSSPRIVVKSGEEASIDVGNEIPVITSNSQSTSDSTAPVIQNIQYRKTGVLLSVKPTVQSNGLVDIDITQELSEEQITRVSATGSPIILTRKIKTSLTLRDGGSVLLGGLISTSQSKGQDGVPFLGKLPVLGRLFRTDTIKEDRTELLILVIPYVINNQSDAISLTEAMRERLSWGQK